MKRTHPIIPLFSMFSLWIFMSLQQAVSQSPSSLIDAHLTSAEKKNLQKADKLDEEAITLNDQAESIKSSGGQSKSNRKVMKAIGKKQEANSLRIKVYQTKLEEFRKSFQGNPSEIAQGQMMEDKANELFAKASAARKKSLSASGKEKDDLLLDASEDEGEGIQNQVEALNFYYNWPIVYQPPSINTSSFKDTIFLPYPTTNDSIPLSLAIDSAKLLGFRKYLLDSFPQQDADSLHYMDVNAFDARTLSRAWYNYLYGPGWQSDTSMRMLADIVNYPPNQEEVTFANEDNVLATKTNNRQTTPTDKKFQEGTKNNAGGKPYKDTVKSKGQGTESSLLTNTKVTPSENNASQENSPERESNSEGSLYKVQIAANRNPLSQNLLRKIYSGNKEITMINENGWHKYSIGDFSSWEEANQFRKDCGVKDAFITRENTKTSATASVVVQPVEKSKVEKISSAAIADLEYRVQIAAGRKLLSDDELRRIYRGNRPITKFAEDGWNRYFIATVKDYQEAIRIQKESGVKKAFVAAYINGIRTDLYATLHPETVPGMDQLTISPTETERQGRIYYLQLAANKTPLNVSFLKQHGIKTGNVLEMQEEGWFKYRLGPFHSRAEAVKAQLALPEIQSFIVQYHNGTKITPSTNATSASTVILPMDMNAKGLHYYLQISASTSRLSPASIRALCPGCDTIYEQAEEGFFKYRLFAGTSYGQACEFRKEYSMPGIFLVAFRDGHKIPLDEAIRSAK